ncbi:Uncharacterised protein [Yersinia rohdei]|nr:Uncharacterised protein [Yersinia rohdei]
MDLRHSGHLLDCIKCIYKFDASHSLVKESLSQIVRYRSSISSNDQHHTNVAHNEPN